MQTGERPTCLSRRSFIVSSVTALLGVAFGSARLAPPAFAVGSTALERFVSAVPDDGSMLLREQWLFFQSAALSQAQSTGQTLDALYATEDEGLAELALAAKETFDYTWPYGTAFPDLSSEQRQRVMSFALSGSSQAPAWQDRVPKGAARTASHLISQYFRPRPNSARRVLITSLGREPYAEEIAKCRGEYAGVPAESLYTVWRRLQDL